MQLGSLIPCACSMHLIEPMSSIEMLSRCSWSVASVCGFPVSCTQIDSRGGQPSEVPFEGEGLGGQPSEVPFEGIWRALRLVWAESLVLIET